MNTRYQYNKNNSFYDKLEKISEDKNIISYKPNQEIDKFDYESVSIQLTYKDVKKPNIKNLYFRIMKKYQDSEKLTQVIDNNFLLNNLLKENSNILEKYIKQDIKSTTKSLKHNLKNLENKNKITIKYNIENILYRFEENFFNNELGA